MKRPAGHMAIYGNVVIPRSYCQDCQSWAFVIDGRLRCCGEKVATNPKKFKQMSEAPLKRWTPGKKDQRRILAEQNHCCFYCGRNFGAVVWRRNNRIALRINWDHRVPFCYGRDNHVRNFVAACHVCNGLKSSHMFKSVEEAQTFLYDRWKQKGYSDSVSDLHIQLRSETPVAKVL